MSCAGILSERMRCESVNTGSALSSVSENSRAESSSRLICWDTRATHECASGRRAGLTLRPAVCGALPGTVLITESKSNRASGGGVILNTDLRGSLQISEGDGAADALQLHVLTQEVTGHLLVPMSGPSR